ncbi:hypothetical protein GE09DRAFT_1226836 [Coniochaeta sp. 2T2.1]|nr:hypothetical protein GE09DRAFT_1226836 [Coniochaeta sp. 2T2.1]
MGFPKSNRLLLWDPPLAQVEVVGDTAGLSTEGTDGPAPTPYGVRSGNKDISTLVRHLGRVTHRLRVSERCIDSFDVKSEELSHVKRGVCRRCWEVFADQEAFHSHSSTVAY